MNQCDWLIAFGIAAIVAMLLIAALGVFAAVRISESGRGAR